MSWAVFVWEYVLAALAAINLLLWTRAAIRLDALSLMLDEDSRRMRRLQIWLSAIYVLGCAFRSVVPVYDIPRIGCTRQPTIFRWSLHAGCEL